MVKSSQDDLLKASFTILSQYATDFMEDLGSELRLFVNESRKEIEEKDSILKVTKLMLESRVTSLFHMVYRLLVLFISIPATVVSAEQSFSKLKLIKTYLRSTMSQQRLDDLAILLIDTKRLINNFANLNAHRCKHFGL